MGDYLSDPISLRSAEDVGRAVAASGQGPTQHSILYYGCVISNRRFIHFQFFHVVGYGFASQLKSSSQFHPFVAEKVGPGFSSCLAAAHLNDDIICTMLISLFLA